ncbi:MAG TPA: cation diffusion facilitator family transporter [Acidimicrobiales bacterium]|nr:cation diffusion facilitator family transporter [Acidimicrobiales bacterium]
MAGSGTKAIVAALAANAGIAVAKFVGYVITGSGSLLAESVHSVADSGNQGLLLLGGKRASRDATAQHNFGFGRERYFWAFIVSLVLFTLGSAFALYEGYQKIAHPHEIESLGVAIGILLFAIVLETFSFRTAIVEANKDRIDAGWWEYIRHSKAPEIPVVLLEDAGALLGLLFALGAVTTAQVTGDPIYDGIGTLGIGVLLGVIAIVLAVEMKSLLMGESATRPTHDSIENIIVEDADVRALLELKTQYLGPEQLLAAVKVQFRAEMTTEEIVVGINRIERAIRAAHPHAIELFVEPDVQMETTAGD